VKGCAVRAFSALTSCVEGWRRVYLGSEILLFGRKRMHALEIRCWCCEGLTLRQEENVGSKLRRQVAGFGFCLR
jgi:hypothetical protein